MDEFHAIAYDYHRHFYSFLEHKKALQWPLIFTILFGALFACSVVFYLQQALETKASGENLNMVLMLSLLAVPEILLIACHDRLKFKRNQITTGFTNLKNLTPQLDKAKIRWLNQRFHTSECSYAGLVLQFQSMRREFIKNRSVFELHFKDILRLIYDPSSKARVASFFIFLLSVCTLITLKSIDNAEVLFAIYYEVFNSYGAMLLTVVSISFFLFLLTTVFCINLVLSSLNVISVVIDKDKAQSDRIASLLIKDMLKYSKLSFDPGTDHLSHGAKHSQ